VYAVDQFHAKEFDYDLLIIVVMSVVGVVGCAVGVGVCVKKRAVWK
jgi:hypothetical protein